ncbi:MAG TPA: hypothetical protein VM450_20465 [Thermomicrobiales bacterium]|nr:hypothetical protein [Thermomicrobiales bacterium]
MFEGLTVIRSRSRRHPGVAYTHALLNGALQSLADVLLQPALLLAATIWLLNGSIDGIAIVAVAAAAPWAVCAILVPFLQLVAETIPAIALISGLVRAASAALIAFLGWRATSIDGADLVILLTLAYIGYQLSSAVSAQVSHGIIAGTTLSAERVRTLRDRRLAGAAMAVLGGLIAWRVFAANAISLPRAAGWLLMLAGMAVVAATWFQLTSPGMFRPRRTFYPSFGGGTIAASLRTRPVRRYAIFRLLLGLSTLADPFIIVYGLSAMNLHIRYIGGAILFHALAQVVGGVLWPMLLAARGSRRPIQIATLLRLAALALAVVVPQVATSQAYVNRFDTPTLASWAFVATFALLGLVRSAHDQTEQQYLADIVPEPSPHMAAIMGTNVLLLLTSGAALLGAFLIDRYSLDTTLTIAAVISFAALLASGLLFEGNPRVVYRGDTRTTRPRQVKRLRRRTLARAR